MAWEPIETAPKDGRTVLTINRERGWVNISRWDAGFEVFMANDGMPSFATHWMPIPPPPVAERDLTKMEAGK